jgi:SAM-dependent methyltransferase
LVSRVLGDCLRRIRATPPISAGHTIIEGEISPTLHRGWQDPSIVARQQAAFEPLLTQLRAGEPRRDFVALAEAVKAAQVVDPLIVEVGCATGWNAEVLTCLLRQRVRYVGVDYSTAMVAGGKHCYPETQFAVGDAVALPLGTGICDVLISGTVLMHVADYRHVVHESRRVTRRWCIFHTVPVLRHRSTTVLSKLAYGQPVVEVIFNESELLALFETTGLRLRHRFENIPYDLESLLGEPTRNYTYLCEAQRE